MEKPARRTSEPNAVERFTLGCLGLSEGEGCELYEGMRNLWRSSCRRGFQSFHRAPGTAKTTVTVTVTAHGHGPRSRPTVTAHEGADHHDSTDRRLPEPIYFTS